MVFRKFFSAETWALGSNIKTLIVAAAASVAVFETTPWLALASLAVFVAAFAYLAHLNSVAVPVKISPVALAGAIGTVYIAVSAIWSGDPGATGLSAAVLAVVLLAVMYAAAFIQVCPRPWIEHAARALLVTWIFALTFLLFELLTGDIIKKALFWPYHALRWKPGTMTHLDWSQGPVIIKPQSIKWNMAPLNYLLWPSLLILCVQPMKAAWRIGFGLVLAGAVALTTHLADHKTSLLALAIAVAIFIVALRFPNAVLRLLQGYWIAGFVVIVPLAIWAYDSGMHLEQRTSRTLAARIILWNFTAHHVGERPLLGVGAAATRRLDNEREAISPAEKPPGFEYAMRTGPHAHNFFLQSWYELGLLGSAVFLTAGLLVLERVRQFAAGTKPFVLATAATVLVTDTASFGLFEVWFMATFAMCCVAALLAEAEYRRVRGL